MNVREWVVTVLGLIGTYLLPWPGAIGEPVVPPRGIAVRHEPIGCPARVASRPLAHWFEPAQTAR